MPPPVEAVVFLYLSPVYFLKLLPGFSGGITGRLISTQTSTSGREGRPVMQAFNIVLPFGENDSDNASHAASLRWTIEIILHLTGYLAQHDQCLEGTYYF